MTLSNSEDEWVALSEVVKEVMFIIHFLLSMKISVKLPVIISVDNVGAIFMVSSISASSHTKHVDIRYKYVTKYVEDGIVKIVFMKSSDNVGNILTKNLS